MPLYRGNDMNLVSEVLKDSNDATIETGVVEAEVLTEDCATVLIVKAAMTHDAGGVWKRTIQAEDIDGIATAIKHAKTRITIASPPDATFVRVDEVMDRRSA